MQKLYSLLIFNIGVTAGNIAVAQNVGIGTNVPSEKLHVAGNIKADTIKPNALRLTFNAGEGKLLTSDASGNASWQTPAAGTSSNAVGGAGFGAWGDCNMNGVSEYYPVADTGAAANDNFGTSVAISGNIAVIGNVGKNCAYVYQFNGSTWALMQKLTDPSIPAQSGFGFSVAISGNFVIVGALSAAIGENPQQGSASIFRNNGTSWLLFQKLTDPSGAAGDAFGGAVSISGDYAIVGSILDDVGLSSADQGSASIFHFNGTSWVFVQKLLDAGGSAGDVFGASVSISGNFAVVGAPLDDIGTHIDQGSASIFQLNGSNWIFIKKIIDSANNTGVNTRPEFAASVSISGKYMAVGIPQDTLGGSCNIYALEEAQWNLVQKFKDDDVANAGQFGTSVSLSGDYVLVGEQSHKFTTGAAISFARVGLAWQKIQFIADPAGQLNNLFGRVVAIDGNSKRFLIGAPLYANGSGKVIFGKIN